MVLVLAIQYQSNGLVGRERDEGGTCLAIQYTSQSNNLVGARVERESEVILVGQFSGDHSETQVVMTTSEMTGTCFWCREGYECVWF